MHLIKKTDRIFVAGHTGMAGSAIVRELSKKGYSNLFLTNRKQLDLLDYQAVKKWFEINTFDEEF